MSSESSVIQQLCSGFEALGLSLSYEPFFTYLELLQKWNHAYNLTAVRDLESMISKHLLDSLAILPYLKGHFILDVGAGAGFPGIPLALANPALHIVLLDSNGKKVRFMQEVKRVLGIKHIEIVYQRIENYRPARGFDTVVSRAFSDLEQFIQWTKHVLAADGRWLAMKGRFPSAELETINQPYQVQSYTVPGLAGERCCVIIDKE